MNTYQKPDNKIIRTYVINQSLYEQFKTVAEKDMRKLSNIPKTQFGDMKIL